jgi:hypothetical protein
VTAECTYYDECCTAAEKNEITERDLILCLEQPPDDYYSICLHEFGASIEDGSVVIDPAALRYYEDYMQDFAESCQPFGLSPERRYYYHRIMMIEPVFLGQKDEGQSCNSSIDCREGLFCDRYSGTCNATDHEGGLCSTDIECEVGLVCSNYSCAHPGTEGDGCTDNDDCSIGYWCEDGSCTPLLVAGEECHSSDWSCEGICSSNSPSTCRNFCDGI